jgi:enamine deaminase RidA (YjgF/YER057c/UK114 family)
LIAGKRKLKNKLMIRTNYSSGAKWEDIVGYSRAVKVGNTIEVTGTVAVDDAGNLAGGNDAYKQTKFIIQKIEKVLLKAGSSLKDVVRTRMFVTDISRWEEYGKAHGEFFKDIRPCTTMLEISKLIAPEYLIEIEATAIINTETLKSGL